MIGLIVVGAIVVGLGIAVAPFIAAALPWILGVAAVVGGLGLVVWIAAKALVGAGEALGPVHDAVVRRYGQKAEDRLIDAYAGTLMALAAGCIWALIGAADWYAGPRGQSLSSNIAESAGAGTAISAIVILAAYLNNRERKPFPWTTAIAYTFWACLAIVFGNIIPV